MGDAATKLPVLGVEEEKLKKKIGWLVMMVLIRMKINVNASWFDAEDLRCKNMLYASKELFSCVLWSRKSCLGDTRTNGKYLKMQLELLLAVTMKQEELQVNGPSVALIGHFLHLNR